MASVNVNLSCDLQHPVRVQYLDGNLFSMDNGGNTINIMVYDNGEPAAIGGSVTANVIRADGGTVAVSGAIDGNRAYVILPQACYAVPGALSVIIKLTEGTTVTTIAAFVANVYQSSTDETIDPGTIIPSVENLISEIESAIADIPVGYNASFAPAYSTSETYAIGQYVTYNGYLWRCTTAITSAESWTSSHWTQVALAEDVSNLKSALIDEGTIRKVYTPVFISENTTTSSAGKFDNGSSGTNAYVYEISAGTNIVVTASGNVVGYYATLPVKGSTYTIDNTRRVGTLNNTKLTIPTGASYIAISATSEPYVIADTKTTSETVEELETNIESVDSKIGLLENKLINNGTILRQYDAVNQYSGCTVNASGYIDNGVSGVNVYVFNVAAGTKITVTGGNVYGTFATNPVKNTTQATDQTRHVGNLNNTVITMPTGANYIAIANGETPVVLDYGQTTSQIVDNFEDEFDYINGLADAEITFENEGYINAFGAFISNTAYRSTGFMPVSENGTFIPISYRVKGIDATCIAFFDGQKQLIKAIPIGATSSLEEKTGTLEYASGSVYARICTYIGSGGSAYSDYYAKYGTIKNTVTGIILYPTDYQGSEISVFNKILCIGDSLTSGTFNYRVGTSTGNYVENAKYSYPAYLKKIAGVDTVNMGNGGKTSLEWYQLHANDDLSGYDCAIIQLGVNDVGRYGTWGQDSIDGFTNIIAKLKTENKNIKIFVANIIPARSYHNDAYIAMSNAIKTFITGLEDQQVILLDIQQYGHTYDSAAYNCGHLSALGYWRLAQDYKAYISWYIFMNKTNFKEIQFIGTDYYYDPIN